MRIILLKKTEIKKEFYVSFLIFYLLNLIENWCQNLSDNNLYICKNIRRGLICHDLLQRVLCGDKIVFVLSTICLFVS